MNPNESLEARIAKLEGQVRRGRVWSTCGLVLLGTVVLGSMQSPAEKGITVDRIVTKQLEVVDTQGKLRASLGPDPRRGGEDAVALSIHGPGESKSRATISADGPMAEITLLSDPKGSGRLYLYADDGGSGATLSSAPQGTIVPGPNAMLQSTYGAVKLELSQAKSASAAAVEARILLTPDRGLERSQK